MSVQSAQNIGEASVREALANKAQGLANRPLANDAAQRRKLAQEFTAFLYSEVLKAMRAASPQESVQEGEGMSRDMYTSMMDNEIARLMAQRDSTGITSAVARAFDRGPAVAPTISQPNTVKPLTQNDLAPAVEKSLTPASGVISSAYGKRTDPIDGSNKFHAGVDIAAPAGTPVRSVAAGRVVFSGFAPGYGNMIEIDHGNGWRTRYGHNANNLVTQGELIEAGQPIALVGHTGRATGDHVHFEVRRDGKAVDPSVFLSSTSKGSKLSSKA
jgi:murein DD-endopeptidase MepM/ murein hydrolase activator NlpD